MKKKLSLSTMAKKNESKRKAELDAKRMSNVSGGSVEWTEGLCEDWCSLGTHFYTENRYFCLEECEEFQFATTDRTTKTKYVFGVDGLV